MRICRKPIAPDVNANDERQPRVRPPVPPVPVPSGSQDCTPGVGPVSGKERTMSIRNPYPDVGVPEIALHGFVLERSDRRGAAVPLMGPADPGTATPLMGPTDHSTAIPLVGPAAPGTAVPLMGPADPGTATPLMGPSR